VGRGLGRELRLGLGLGLRPSPRSADARGSYVRLRGLHPPPLGRPCAGFGGGTGGGRGGPLVWGPPPAAPLHRRRPLGRGSAVISGAGAVTALLPSNTQLSLSS
jgi:hypothetical protein